METRNIPVLGEEDLEGAGGLDQMRENRGGPSHLMHSNQMDIYEGLALGPPVVFRCFLFLLR